MPSYWEDLTRSYFLSPLVVTNRTTHQHVRRGLCAGGLLVEPEEEAELGAGRAEEELRQPPPVRILGQVQQRRPVWKDVPTSTSAMSQNQKEDEGSSSSRRTPFVKNFSKGFSVSKTQRRMVLWKRSKFGTQNQTL